MRGWLGRWEALASRANRVLRLSSPTRPSAAVIRDEIRYLLRRDHVPRVTVAASPTSGKGVFVVKPETPSRCGDRNNSKHRNYTNEGQSGWSSSKESSTGFFPAGAVLCLYPGVHTPPLPSSLASDANKVRYLGSQTTPSGSKPRDNGYLLQLHCVNGGYLDGNPVLFEGLPLQDNNPSACGHFVNHSIENANVAVMSFPWSLLDEVNDGPLPKLSWEGSDLYYPVPNTNRSDGSPWYEVDDGWCREQHFPTNQESALQSAQCCGAVLYATTNIPAGNELFLHYQLRKPYPRWAQDWYSRAS
jgi:hypothetical protein